MILVMSPNWTNAILVSDESRDGVIQAKEKVRQTPALSEALFV